MQTPKNNLEDVLRRKRTNSIPSKSHHLMPALKATRFKPALPSNANFSSSNAARQTTSSHLPSFSTPGFGKSRSLVHDKTLHQLDVVCISSDSTPSSPPRRVKRTSSDPSITPDPSPQLKRLKKDDFSEKENIFRSNLTPSYRNEEKLKPNPQVRLFSRKRSSGMLASGEHNPCTMGQDYASTDYLTRNVHTSHDIPEQDCDLISVDTEKLNAFLVNNFELVSAITERELLHHRTPTMMSDVVILERIRASLAVRIESIKKVLASRKPDHYDAPTLQHKVALTSREKILNSQLQNDEVHLKLMVGNASDQDVDENEIIPASEVDYWEGMEDVTMDDSYSDTLDFSKGTPLQSASKATHTNLNSTPYYNEIMCRLRDVFGLHKFRRNQLEIITEALSARDVFVLMPTGGGKSLCYQLPAVCTSGETTGVTVVVSPLLALMKDQVHALQEKGVDVFLWNSEASWDEAMQRMRIGPKPSLMYITPEKLKESNVAQNVLAELYNKEQLARFVIDEAHCISTWGQDFRDAYRDLDQLRIRYPTVPIMALTATARKNTIADIIKRLGLRNHAFFTQSFNRPNLRYIVESKGKNWEGAMMDFIASNHPNKSGVIYCLGRDKCEEVAKKMKDRGFKAEHFHAGMTPADKDRTLDEWRRNRVHIIVATIAFGMGIDKADVRFVIHYTLPKSLDGYYQETGRAGRDGEPADCILYFHYKDFTSIKNMIERPDRDNVQPTPQSIARQTVVARAVVDYCQNISICRRVQLLHYFDEKFEEESCGRGCDNCAHPAPLITRNISTEARVVVQLVESFQEKKESVTLIQCRDILRGANTKMVRLKKYDKLQCYGMGRDLPPELLEQMIQTLCLDEVLKEVPVMQPSGYHTDYVVLGPSAEEFLRTNKVKEIQWRPKVGKTKQNVISKVSRPKGKHRALPDVDDPIELYEDDPLPVVMPDVVKWEPKNGRKNQETNHTASKETTKSTNDIKQPDAHIGNLTTIHHQMLHLRQEIAARDCISVEDVLSDFTIQLLSSACPQDYVAFKSIMKEGLQEKQSMSEIEKINFIDNQYNNYGADFMNLCIEHKFNAKPFAGVESSFHEKPCNQDKQVNTITNIRKSKFKPPRS